MHLSKDIETILIPMYKIMDYSAAEIAIAAAVAAVQHQRDNEW